MPGNFLGNDTSIYRRDSIQVAIPFSFDHCQWSTGDTTASITLHGADLGVGVHLVSVTAEKGPCSVSDTLKLTVSNNPGVAEEDQRRISIHPNPARGQVTVEVPGCQEDGIISILAPSGQEVATEALRGSHAILDVSTLPGGVYFVRIRTASFTETRKLVIQ